MIFGGATPGNAQGYEMPFTHSGMCSSKNTLTNETEVP